MAALYLHNALFSAEDPPAEPVLRHTSSSHLRKSSSVSTVTLQTMTSRPTEPLLSATAPGSPGFSQSTPTDSDVVALHYPQNSSPNAKSDGCWEHAYRRRLKMLRTWKRALLAINSSWAFYNSIRYFLSFPNFTSRERQLFALLLGASTTLSLALVTASLLLNLLLPTPTYFPKTPGMINVIKRIILPYFASWLILAPAIVNFVLLFVWRDASDPQKTLQGRCSWDIDVVWSGIGMSCTAPGSSPPWPFWLIGAILRLVSTCCFLAAYHVICHKLEVTRRPKEESPYTRFPAYDQRRHHHYHDSSVTNTNTRATTGQSYTPISSMISAPPIAHAHQHRRSLSTTDDIEKSSPSSYTAYRNESNHLSQPRTPKITPSHSYSSSPRIIPDELSSSFAGQSTSSDDNVSIETSTGDGSTIPGRFASGSNDAELHGFVSRFRAVVDQISKETEEGLNLRPDSRMDHPHDRYTDSSNSDDDEFNPYNEVDQMPSSSHIQGEDWYYNEFGQPVLLQQPDDGDGRVEVFGRFVHRMPTIESLGSRERNSLATPSMSLHQMEREMSTRSNTLSDHDRPGSPVSWGRPRSDSCDATSRVPSRQAFRVTGEVLMPNELGELVSRPASRAMPDHSSTGRSGGEISIVTGSSQGTTINTFYSATGSSVNMEIE